MSKASAHADAMERLPPATALRGFIETLDRRLLSLLSNGDEPDDATVRSISHLESARTSAVRILEEAIAKEAVA